MLGLSRLVEVLVADVVADRAWRAEEARLAGLTETQWSVLGQEAGVGHDALGEVRSGR